MLLSSKYSRSEDLWKMVKIDAGASPKRIECGPMEAIVIRLFEFTRLMVNPSSIWLLLFHWYLLSIVQPFDLYYIVQPF
jgi:hypothetical protein